MKIVLDQRACNCWNAACEAHFGNHFLGQEVTPVDCTTEVSDDGRAEITFLIKDRDGSDKILVVDEANRGEAYDSWRLAWEQQNPALAAAGAAPKPAVKKPAALSKGKPAGKKRR